MKYILKKIDKNLVIQSITKSKADLKWFLYLFRISDVCYESISIEINGEYVQVGFCIWSDNKTQCSIFIFASYRRMGICSELIKILVARTANLLFRVSKENKVCIGMFERKLSYAEKTTSNFDKIIQYTFD